jgi:hypothetical protein
MSKPEATLRTMMSLWLEQTDALAERLVSTEIVQGEYTPTTVLALRHAQHVVSLLFAHNAQFTPERYAKLVGASEKARK